MNAETQKRHRSRIESKTSTRRRGGAEATRRKHSKVFSALISASLRLRVEKSCYYCLHMAAVEIASVTKTFGSVTAVDNLTLTVPDGSVYGFIGPNGSGKTTTMRMIVNIFYPDSGSIRVLGQQMTSARSEHIGYLPEERGLYRNMAVKPLLEFFGELRGGRRVTAEVDSWIQRLNLTKWASQKVQTLSKGMSQKVQFIAAVVPEPKLVILDEPFSGLDPVSADAIR